MKDNRFGFIASLFLHIGIACIILFGGMFWKKPFEVSPPCTIPLEITAISDHSKAPISKPKALKPKEQQRAKDTTGEEAFIEEIMSQPPSKEESTPKPIKNEPQESIASNLPEKKEDKKKTLDDLIKEIVPEEKKKPEKKPEKKVQKGKKNKSRGKEDFIKVLKDCEVNEEGPSAETPITDRDARSIYGASHVGEKMSMSITDRVRRLLENAWLVPQRAQDGRALIVHMRVEMNRDGTPRSIRPIHNLGTPNHPAYRIAVDFALQAIEKCSPLPLPEKYYDQWKTLDIPFKRQ